MTNLIAGMLVFVAIHLLPTFQALRSRLINRLGLTIYKTVFALIALGGFALIVYGKATADHVPVWPSQVPDGIAALLVFAGFVLIPATALPSNIKRFTRHPLLWGVVLWAAGHLLVNGDLASIILFGGFLSFSLFAMWSQNRRGAALSTVRLPLSADILVVMSGASAFVLLAFAHPYMTGVPAMS